MEINSFNLEIKTSQQFLIWLESVIVSNQNLEMTSERICQEVGKK